MFNFFKKFHHNNSYTALTTSSIVLISLNSSGDIFLFVKRCNLTAKSTASILSKSKSVNKFAVGI